MDDAEGLHWGSSSVDRWETVDLSDNKEIESGGLSQHLHVVGKTNRVQSKMFLRFPVWEESRTIIHGDGDIYIYMSKVHWQLWLHSCRLTNNNNTLLRTTVSILLFVTIWLG